VFFRGNICFSCGNICSLFGNIYFTYGNNPLVSDADRVSMGLSVRSGTSNAPGAKSLAA
jgi:hypothetical protein